MANNINLIEKHIQESLKQLNVSDGAGAEAWANFEKKYSTINIINQSIQKTKRKSVETLRDSDGKTSSNRWIILVVALLFILIGAYFAWPYVLNWSSANTAPKKDTIAVTPPPTIVNTPQPVLPKKDGIKPDTLIIPEKSNLPAAVLKQNITPIINNTITNTAPIINKPKREIKTDITPKTENVAPKKTEGEFDFFDKPANDSLLIEL